MKFLIIALAGFLTYDSTSYINVRDLYIQAIETETGLNRFNRLLETLPSDDQIIVGYKAMAIMIAADFKWNPYKKFELFNIGKEQLEKAIANEQNCAELVYLRYGIQTNVPDFLDYSHNTESDRIFLEESIKTMEDVDLKKRISDYLNKEL